MSSLICSCEQPMKAIPKEGIFTTVCCEVHLYFSRWSAYRRLKLNLNETRRKSGLQPRKRHALRLTGPHLQVRHRTINQFPDFVRRLTSAISAAERSARMPRNSGVPVRRPALNWLLNAVRESEGSHWHRVIDPVYMSRKIESFERINSIRETNGILTLSTHVNGWFPAVYMSCMSQNFRLFHVSNLSVRNFRIFLLMYTW